MEEKRKSGNFRRMKFSKLYQEKQLLNKKNEDIEEIRLNVVIKGKCGHQFVFNKIVI